MIEERMPGTNPLFETRKESELQVDRQKRYKQITEILKDYPNGLTAKEISVEMKKRGYTPTDERNFSSPRITEMLISGAVECIGKKKCIYTNRNVGVFKLRVKQST